MKRTKPLPTQKKRLPSQWRNVSDSTLEDALAAIMYDFDSLAARNLIEYFYDRLSEGEGVNEKVLHKFLVHAFGKIVNDDASADVALGLKLARGKYPRRHTIERDVMAAAFMVLLIRQGRTWQFAKGEAANSLFPDGKGEKAIEAAYVKYREVFETLPDAILSELVPGPL